MPETETSSAMSKSPPDIMLPPSMEITSSSASMLISAAAVGVPETDASSTMSKGGNHHGIHH